MPRGDTNIRQEGPHASRSIHPGPPPRPRPGTQPLPVSQLWQALTTDQRRHILNALSRVVAAHLVRGPLPREVPDEPL
jgi:hypothetical protein